jgi:AcrR family transcriptional regulator
MKPKPKPRQKYARGQGDQLRSDLIDAAIRILADNGSNGQFSLRAVAKEARVAAPSIYLHFSDLNELRLAVLERLFAEQIAIRNQADEEAGKAGGGAWERLLAGSLALVRFGLERPGHYKVMYEGRVILRLNDPRAATFGRPMQNRSVELISELVKKRAAKGLSEDPNRLALLLWTGIHGIISLQINKPTLDWPAANELATQLARFVIRPGSDG